MQYRALTLELAKNRTDQTGFTLLNALLKPVRTLPNCTIANHETKLFAYENESCTAKSCSTTPNTAY